MKRNFLWFINNHIFFIIPSSFYQIIFNKNKINSQNNFSLIKSLVEHGDQPFCGGKGNSFLEENVLFQYFFNFIIEVKLFMRRVQRWKMCKEIIPTVSRHANFHDNEKYIKYKSNIITIIITVK